MIKILLVILLFTVFSNGQMPTPTPILTDEQKSADTEFREKSLVIEKQLPAKQSPTLLGRYEANKYINLFLTSYRAKTNEPGSEKMSVNFDFSQNLQSEDDTQNSVIEDAVLLIDDKEITFQMPKEETTNNSPRFWQFQIMLSPEETVQLRNANKISLKWNKGSFDVDPNDLENVKKFIDDEMPNLKAEQASRISGQKVSGENLFSSFLNWLS